MNDRTIRFFTRKAHWILSPEVPNPVPGTFLLFRKTFEVANVPRVCRGRVFADTQYRLWVNGRYVQSGPAPCDPRWPEVDPHRSPWSPGT